MLMKKLFYIFVATAVAFTACQKPAVTPDKQGDGQEEQKQDDKTEVKDAITLISDEVVNVGAESEIITVKFTATADWTAESEEDFIVPKDKSGKAGENVELKVTIQSLPNDVEGRTGALALKAGKAEATVYVMQGKVFFFTPEELYVGIEGGKVEFQVVSNLDYEVKIYDSFYWAPATFDKATGMGSFTVAANTAYDMRVAYVKFTIPDIQVPVYNDDGEPTGETKDCEERIYVYQDGNRNVAWATSLPANFDVVNIDDDGVVHDATASLALFDGKLLVCDAKQIFTVNLQTGKFEGTLNVGDLPVQSITNDDAGNLLLAELGPYLNVYNVYAIKANDTQLASPKNIIHAVNETWAGSHGADKVAARGDVYGDGVITMMYGGLPQYGGSSYGMCWEIKGGKAAEEYYNEYNPIINQPQMIVTPIGTIVPEDWLYYNLWLSNRAAFVPAGTAVSDGFFYCGYDDQYNLFYYNGTDWAATLEVGDWAGSIMGMETITWNEKKILAGVGLGYTFDWGPMPSYLWLVDITTPAAPEVLSSAQYGGLEDQAVTGGTESSTADVVLQIDGDSLVSYFVDSSQGILSKVVYPKR